MIRSKKEVDTVHLHAEDKEGKEVYTIESLEDKSQRCYYTTIEENEYIDSINTALSGIKKDYSLIIKLELLYYFDINNDELEIITTELNKNPLEIIKKISDIRKELEEKSRIISMKEGQIEKVYSVKYRLSKRLALLKKEEQAGGDVGEEISEIERKISKRKSQLDKVLSEKEKGLYIVKTPHKVIAEFLKISENAAGIRIHRAYKALKEKLISEGIV
jgi:hypothetical protein